MQKNQTTQLMIFIAIAYIFSIAVRLIWVYHFGDNEQFMWNGQLMINTNDGYYFAEKAKEILHGTRSYLDLDRNGAVAPVTAFLVQVLPFSFETIILYMPAFLGSLLVVPLVLIGNSLEQRKLGLLAAMLGGIVWSYYNRTMVGYYDSDMLNIVFPVFVLWSIIHALTTQKNRYLVLMVIVMILSQWWYPKNIALNTAMIFMALMYVMIQDRKNLFNLKLLIFALIALALIPIYVKIVLVVLFFGIFHYKSEWSSKYLYPLLGVMVGVYLFSGALNGILSSLNLYLIQRFFPQEVATDIAQLHFFGVINTVREAGAIPFETFANRISGHTITFLLSSIGVILLMVRYPIMIISLPLVAMGFMAYKAGLRFTVYAVPVYALGFGYLLVFASRHIASWVSDDTKKKLIRISFTIGVMVLALYPNIKHIQGYLVPTVLNKVEVNDLVKLDEISSNEDYTLGWWDYGYPIRYYGGTRTLIDGGKHQNDNFIVSTILQTSSPELAANLSRLSVETYEDSGYKTVADTIFKNKQKDQLNPNLLLSELEMADYSLPKKTRDIYLYLPYRMMRIFPTVAVFGNLDLTTGDPLRKVVFYPTVLKGSKQGLLTFANGIGLDTKKGELLFGQEKKQVKHFIVTQYTKDGKMHLQSQPYHASGEFAVVYMKSYGQFIIMDMQTFYSNYVQMFILEKYDKGLFELVVSSPYSKIYRLKK